VRTLFSPIAMSAADVVRIRADCRGCLLFFSSRMQLSRFGFNPTLLPETLLKGGDGWIRGLGGVYVASLMNRPCEIF
jgi:hypothetical protein